MKQQLKYIALLLGVGLSLGFIASGAPTQTFYKDIFPISDVTYNIGTSTRQWLSISVKNASSTALSIPSTGYFNLNATGTMQGFSICTSGNGACGTGGGSGTVTSVDATVPTGLSVSGVPFTTAGTIALTLTAGYNIPLTASTTNWNDIWQTPSNRITDGTNLTWSSNTLNVDDPFSVTNLTATNASTTYLTISSKAFINDLASTTMNGFNLCTSSNGACPSGSGVPAGLDKQVQFNDSNLFGGNSAFTFDKTGNTLLTFTNASTTNFSIGSTGSFNLNATGTMQGWALCTAGNGACGAGSVPNSTVTASEEIWDCVPQTDSTGFAPGGSFIDVMGENLLAIHQMNSTTSAIYCRWHVPDDIAASPSAVLFTNYAATSSGNLAIDIYATTTPSNGGVYGTFGLWTTVKAGSTSPVTITGGSDYQSTSTTTPINLTLTAGDDLIFRMIRWATDANDTVEGAVFFVKNYVRFLKVVN